MFVTIIEDIEAGKGISENGWRFLESWALGIIREWFPDLDREDEKDICQDCLLRLLKALPAYDTRRPLSPLYGIIIRNKCLQYQRPRKTPRTPLPDNLISKDPKLGAWIDYSALWERIPESMRDIAMMMQDGYGTGEIATAKGYSSQNASQRIGALRDYLVSIGYSPESR